MPKTAIPLLFLDLRRRRQGAIVVPQGFSVREPDPDCAVKDAAAVLVAVDSRSGLREWQERLLPCCPQGFPHVVLCDPYGPLLARQAIAGGAADCCGSADRERIALILFRLARDTAREPVALSASSYAMRMQAALDTLPSPLFVKDRNCRYIACNRAFEAQIGVPRSRIIGASVYDVAPPDLAAVYEEADRSLLRAGGTQIYEAQVRFADGSLHDVLFHKAVFADPLGDADGIAGVMLDISDRKRLEERLQVLAATDFLTGAYNLRSFYDLAGKELARVERGAAPFSLIVMDLDRFKDINDRLGHAAGDEALRLVVAAARSSLREQDILARAGGDEFRILLPETLLSAASQVGERIREAVAKLRVSDQEHQIPLSLSAGAASFRCGDRGIDTVVARADAALYRAKSKGRNRLDCEDQLP